MKVEEITHFIDIGFIILKQYYLWMIVDKIKKHFDQPNFGIDKDKKM